MKIWYRYLFFRLIKSFLFILASIFIVFVILDLATKGGKLFGPKFLPSYETFFFYCYQFSNYLHLFFPFSLILASIQVLLDLNAHHELTALQMGGISKKKLLSPFFILASILFFLSLANQQWVVPKALSAAEAYVKAYARHKKRPPREHVHAITLSDGSEMVYQKFDEQKKELFDVFWIENLSTIWHMKFFQVSPPVGRFVDCFQRGTTQLEKIKSFDLLSFPQITLDESLAFQPFIPYEQRTLTQLAFQAFKAKNERQPLLSHLLYKLIYSLLLFLSIMAIAPICFSFSRNKSSFQIVACTLFVFLACTMLLDGLLILGENQVLPAFAAFGIFIVPLFGWIYRSFIPFVTQKSIFGTQSQTLSKDCRPLKS
jgi:lipopolysaccharide export system permease protein